MKVLIVGLGSIAKKHIFVLNGMGIDSIFALRSSPRSASHPGVTDIYSISDIGKENFDFFLISNITSKHAEVIRELLPFEKPMFIEKPVFGKVSDDNRELLKEIRARGIKTYIGCSLRFLDSLVEIKKLVQGERINEVNIYSGSYLPDWRPNVNYKESYSARKDMGGGVHIDLIHELDYLYWIFGEPVNTQSHFSSKSSLDIDSVDFAHYLWQYRNFNASVTLNYYRRDSRRTMEVITGSNTYLVDLLENKIYKNGEEIFSSEQRLPDTLRDQMKFFVNTILNNNNPGFNNIEEAYKILELCLKD